MFNEIGTMRITENGLRLQQMFAQLHIVQIFLEEYYSPTNEIFAVVKPETGSEHILRNHVGMQDWVPPALLIHLRAVSGVIFSAEKHCLVANRSCVSKAFSDLKALHIGNKLFRTPKGDETLQFDLDWFQDDILLIGG